MTKIFDNILRVLILFLENLSFRPKVHYVNRQLQGTRLKEPTILVCNHIHHLDGPTLCTVMHHNRIHCMAAKDRYDNKLLGFMLRHTGCIPIDRKSLDTSWIHQAVGILRQQKEHIAIFPEGRHGHNGEILPFHAGITTIAAVTQAPIVMVYIAGPYKFLGARHRMIIDTPRHLDPPTNGMTADYIQAETDKLHARMVELQSILRTQIEEENNKH